jgi:hypothetical protein
MHDMLCRRRANQFDNRMLQVKKQLQRNACGFDEGFPLLYSKFIREEIYGQTNADSLTASLGTPGNQQEATTITGNFSTLSRR